MMNDESENMKQNIAPGKPGIPPRWTSSSKTGVGKSLNGLSNVSFTISHGIVNEVYYPREDNPCIRDIELLVADGDEFFSEEKRNTKHTVNMLKKGVPAYKIKNECVQKHYYIEKEILADPLRNTLLQQIKFVPKKGTKNTLHLYVLLAPHINNRGEDNTAWVGDYKGVPMLFAKRENTTLALGCSLPWVKCSAGYVGVSDGWRDLEQHKEMAWQYERAESGNVALIGEIDLRQSNEPFILALGFGENALEAGHRVRGSLLDNFDYAKDSYIKEWEKWQKSLSHLNFPKSNSGKLTPVSAAVLRTHESKYFVGGTIASLSFPWGFSKGDEDVGGYHMVWPRDLVEAAGGFLALHSNTDAFRVLNYLMATQDDDGHWSQNMWMGGKPNWTGIQMDQMALPILLVGLCRRHKAIPDEMVHPYWKIVRKAVAYIVQHGPSTKMDRWEEESGLTPFTLAVEIAALLSAADFAEDNDEPEVAKYCRETADYWNESIEEWTYVTGTSMAKACNVEGYYIRTNPYINIPAQQLGNRTIQIANRPADKQDMPVNELVSVDALALVRYGLRRPDDPKILNTLKVIDAKLKVDTASGPGWHRYNNDGYGEYDNGEPFDGCGRGRVWPLLAGERGHYEVTAGNLDKAMELLKTMENCAPEGLISEQVWDAEDIPEKELFNGKPSGSAMPLVWAHAEYIKLCNSIKHKQIFDMPAHTEERYLKNEAKRPDWKVWRFDQQLYKLPAGKNLRIETKAAARIHWTIDGWDTTRDTDTRDTGLGIHVADLEIPPKQAKNIVFTFYWEEAGHWENKNFVIEINNGR